MVAQQSDESTDATSTQSTDESTNESTEGDAETTGIVEELVVYGRALDG